MSTTNRKTQNETAEEPEKIRSMATAKRKTRKAEIETQEAQVNGNMQTIEQKVQPVEPIPEELKVMEGKNQPAVTITIQSWTTPIVGFVMLIVGLLAGYYIRPLTLAQASIAASSALVTPPVAIPTTDNSAVQKQLRDTVVAKTRHFRGDANAPVTIIEFGDFQCPFCGRFFAETEPQINKAYIQSGKVRFGYFGFAFLGQESNWAAEAAECAADQDKFWEYHDKLYSSQSGENQGAFNKENLKKFAEDIGLDTRAFNECFDSGKYTKLIQEESSVASSIGVRSTPTFLVNGQPLIGAQPFEMFQQTIDAFLK